MNEQGQAPSDGDADQSSPLRERPSPAPHPKPSSTSQPTVPDYDLLRRIGHGAYGDVWLARSKATGALRAAKIVWRQRFADERPFRREFEGIQRFEQISREHPSQLALFHIGRNEAEGYFYYVMELADNLNAEHGVQSVELQVRRDVPIAPQRAEDSPTYHSHTLRADLEHGRLPAARVLEIGLALTEALSHLHSNGLVHRDVKPSNVIFVNGRPKLADIGLVTDASDQCSIVGTEGYLPPEGPGTPQADIFALGKVLYEAATGLDRREFPKLPDDLRSWPDAAQMFELNEIILKACVRDSGHRYQTCDEMHDELALLNQGKSVKQKRTRQQRRLFIKKTGIGLAAFSLLVTGVAILLRGIALTDFYPTGPTSAKIIANELCEKGMKIVRSDDSARFKDAYDDFHSAIAVDSHSVQPYIGLLELQLREFIPGYTPAGMAEMRTIAVKLKTLAPNSAATAVAQSIVNWADWHYPEARRYAMEATNSDPNYAVGHTWYGFMLCLWGYPEEGRKQLEMNASLPSSKANVYCFLGQTYYAQRDYTNAILWERKALKLDAHYAAALFLIGEAQMATGDYSGAVTNFEMQEIYSGANASAARSLSEQLEKAIAEQAARGYWKTQWADMENYQDAGYYWKAVIQLNLGHTDQAFEWLTNSYKMHERDGAGLDGPLSYLFFDPWWNGLHDDPRFRKLLDDIGYTKVIPPLKK